jgi:LacI family transcriptional regulator
VNIYEIAKKAGVSIATVSRVLNNSPNVKQETHEKVELVLKEANYTVNDIARSLATSATNTIGVLTSDVRDSYYANAIYTIEYRFQSLGYNVILSNTGGELGRKKTYLNILLQKKVDGIILVGSVFKERFDNSHILKAAQHVPVVMLNGYLEGNNIYSIVCDDAYATFNIVKHLHSKGYKDIVYFYDVESFSGLAKLQGFQKGLEDCFGKFDSPTVYQVESGIKGGYSGIAALESKGKKYTAVVCSDDLIAAGAIKKLREIGKEIPEDVGVTGFNNSLISNCTYPELFTVDNKVGDMACMAVDILYKVLKGEDLSNSYTVKPELIIRASC